MLGRDGVNKVKPTTIADAEHASEGVHEVQVQPTTMAMVIAMVSSMVMIIAIVVGMTIRLSCTSHCIEKHRTMRSKALSTDIVLCIAGLNKNMNLC